ncbi:MAG: AAA family ATPase [Pseudonocardiaceae bacterium]
MDGELRKPDELHARDREWDALVDFVADPSPGATLGLVYGRRRQGKTLMLELLAEATGGFMFTAREQPERQNLQELSAAYARHAGLPASLAFDNWPDVIDALLGLGHAASEAVPVIIDEFPNLVAQASALPSMIQIALSPRSHATRNLRSRLILCGSALTGMRDLLGGGAPLRGRAKLELVLQPFWYREAASFWQLTDDPELAFRVHALLGGTPAYRAMAYGPPADRQSFDHWVAQRLLNPASALFREGSLLLREESGLTDPAPYHGVLGAIAAGAARRSEIAGRIGRPATAIAHLLAGLQQIGLIARLDDAFRERRGIYRLTDPLIRLHELVIAPNERLLVRERGTQVWTVNADTVAAKIYGPHLEDLAREWCLNHASSAALGGLAHDVNPATIACRKHQQGHEIDVVVVETSAGERRRVVAIGEVKSTVRPIDVAAIARLDHLRDLLPGSQIAAPPRLLLYSRAGFTADARRTASGRHDVELIDLDRLYRGD